MKIIFNLSKYAQEAPVGGSDPSGVQPRNLQRGSGLTSGPISSPKSTSTTPSSTDSGSLEYSYALQRAKQIIAEHGGDVKSANDQIYKEVLSKLSTQDQAKLRKEIEYVLSKGVIKSLYQDRQNSGQAGIGDLANMLSEMAEMEGVDAARTWVEYNIKDDQPQNYAAALNLLDCIERGDCGSAASQDNEESIVQNSLDILNKSAVNALVYLVDHQEVDKAMDHCGSWLGDARRRDRVLRAIGDLAYKGKAIFEKKDLIGSMDYRHSDFLGYYVALHYKNMAQGKDPLMSGDATGHIDKLFSISGTTYKTTDLSSFSKKKQLDAVKDQFNRIDGGLHTHRTAGGKFMFEHIVSEMSKGLSQTPPEPSALCVVLLKLEYMAESSGSRAMSFSQMSGKGKDGEEGGIDFSEEEASSRMMQSSEGQPGQNLITSYVPNQASQALSQFKSEISNLQTAIHKVISSAGRDGNEEIVEYFQGADVRLATAARSVEDWLSGAVLSEKLNYGISPNWHNYVNNLRENHLHYEGRKNKDVIEKQDFTSIEDAPITRLSDGIETTIWFRFVKPNVLSYSQRKLAVADGDSVRMIPIPVFEPKIIGMQFVDKMESSRNEPSKQDKQVADQLSNIYSTKLINGKTLTSDERINAMLEIFKNNVPSFMRGAQILKQAMSGSIKRRIANMLGVNGEDPNVVKMLSPLTSKDGILNKNTEPTLRSLYGARDVLSPELFLRLLSNIAKKVDQIGKPIRPMDFDSESYIRRYIYELKEKGQLTDQETNALILFQAKAQTARGGRTATADEVGAWIKVMAKMML